MSCFESTVSKLCISWETLKAVAVTLLFWLGVSPLRICVLSVVVAVLPYLGFAFFFPFN